MKRRRLSHVSNDRAAGNDVSSGNGNEKMKAQLYVLHLPTEMIFSLSHINESNASRIMLPNVAHNSMA